MNDQSLMSSKEQTKAQHLERFYLAGDKEIPSKTIAYFKPLLGKTKYWVCVLEAKKNKKGESGEPFFDPIWQTNDLDHAIFLWDNALIFNPKKSKPYRNNLIANSELDKAILDDLRKRIEYKKHKVELKVQTYGFSSDDEFVGAVEPKNYTPFGQRENVLSNQTKLLIEAFC